MRETPGDNGSQGEAENSVNYVTGDTVIQVVLDAVELGFVDELRKLLDDGDVVFPVNDYVKRGVQQLLMEKGADRFSAFSKAIVSMKLEECPPGYKCPPIPR